MTRYTTTLPNGRPARSLLSEVFVPRLHYGDSYRVSVRGAEVADGLGTERLMLRACRGAQTVSVEVTDEGPAGPLSCAQKSGRARR